jgi:hypothetical protein
MGFAFKPVGAGPAESIAGVWEMKEIEMKGFFTAAGTVVLSTMNLSGKERLNLQQMAIVTPRTADALGLSYDSLWDALVEAVNAKKQAMDHQHGSPIIVRIVHDPKPVAGTPAATAGQAPAAAHAQTQAQAQSKTPAIPTFGVAASLPLEKAAHATEKNAFIRT